MRQLSRRATIGVWLLALTAGAARAQQQGRPSSPFEAAAAAGGVVTSVANDGVPQFVIAADSRSGPLGATDDGAARWHLGRFARAHNVTPRDLASSSTTSIRTLSSGDVIVAMRQRFAGLDVVGSDVKVFMHADHRLVAISGRPMSTDGADTRFAQTAQQALAAALADRFGAPVSAGAIATVPTASGEPRFLLADDSVVRMPEAAMIRAVLYPVGGRLVAAYIADFYAGPADSSASAAYRAVVSAADGRVLDRRDLTVYEGPGAPPHGGNPPPPPPPEFHYRVFADPATQRPLDGPQEATPHPTGVPDGTFPPFTPANLVTMGGFNHPVTGTPDPWLPADALETIGNNAEAYTDYNDAQDGFTPGIDFHADLTSPRFFDRSYDFTREPVATIDQAKASITNAFYTVNWLHDYWYDSGFDEVAGNAQQSNYGRGGSEGDSMKVEVQDNFLGGSRNNANMSTPLDGLRPRMQMFTFTGPVTASLTFTPGGAVTPGGASFGATNFDVTAQVVLANDGVGDTSDACEALSGVTGKIVLADRGTCTFVTKAHNAQAAGAVGIIIANNVAGPPPGIGGTDPTSVIAVQSVSLADGTAVKASLAAGPVTAHMFGHTGVGLDGAIDNTIVSHEWGHYLHHRLADCGQQQCSALSEGWGDFVALHTIARDGDNLNGTFAVGTYATSGFGGDTTYFGIRRAPYSVDFTKNALTFKDISNGVTLPTTMPILVFGNNSEVHNAGEIWT